MIRNICIFASSCNFLDESYYKEAEAIGQMMASASYNMVYGGSALGLMWACAKNVKAFGGKIIGIMPENSKKWLKTPKIAMNFTQQKECAKEKPKWMR